MEVVLTPSQESLVQQAVREGRVASREEAVCNALKLWEDEEIERRELIAMIAEADAEIERGDYIEINSQEELHELFEDVKRRGRERWLAAQANNR